MAPKQSNQGMDQVLPGLGMAERKLVQVFQECGDGTDMGGRCHTVEMRSTIPASGGREAVCGIPAPQMQQRGEPDLGLLQIEPYFRSKRSAFITLVQAVTKSRTNFSLLSS